MFCLSVICLYCHIFYWLSITHLNFICIELGLAWIWSVTSILIKCSLKMGHGKPSSLEKLLRVLGMLDLLITKVIEYVCIGLLELWSHSRIQAIKSLGWIKTEKEKERPKHQLIGWNNNQRRRQRNSKEDRDGHYQQKNDRKLNGRYRK